MILPLAPTVDQRIGSPVRAVKAGVDQHAGGRGGAGVAVEDAHFVIDQVECAR